MRAFTLLEIFEIEKIVMQHFEKPELRYGQKQLANYVTQTLFGLEAAQQAAKISDFLFASEERITLLQAMSESDLLALQRELGLTQLPEHEMRILEILVATGLTESNGEAKKLIQQGAIFVNERKVTDLAQSYSSKDTINQLLLIRRGKKIFKLAQF